jgi:hypothetical protein
MTYATATAADKKTKAKTARLRLGLWATLSRDAHPTTSPNAAPPQSESELTSRLVSRLARNDN